MTTTDEPGNEASPAKTGATPLPDAQQTMDVRPIVTPLWAIILTAYALLFFSTGYMVFLGKAHEPSFDYKSYAAAVTQFDDPEKTVILKEITDFTEQAANRHEEEHKLASQSFNVVLGALLGFLSASAAVAVGRPRRR